MNFINRLGLGLISSLPLFAAVPSTTNYQLYDYGFGNGGGSGGTANYSIEGQVGEQSGQDMSTVNYGLGSGLLEAQQANVPSVTLTNPSSSSDTLHLVIQPASNPSDALFAVAISNDNFVTTNYVQSDSTVGASLGIEDYQTYAAWGSGTGMDIIGLSSNSTYHVKAKAMTGEFTESGYGPSSSALTTDLTLAFDIDIASTNTESAPPYAIALGDLLPATVTSSSNKIWLDLETNGSSGGTVFILSANTGLNSARAAYTIASSSGNLAILNEGFGAQGSTVTQSSGGPLAIESPYTGGSDNVGIIDNSFRRMLSSSAALTAGRSSFVLKAKAASTTPAATDYVDTYTLVAAAAF